MDIINRIKERMDYKNMTILDVIEKSRLKRSTVYYILESEENALKCKVENLIAISNALDCNLDYITKGILSKEQVNSNIQTLYNLLNEPNRIALEAYAEGMAMAQYGADLSTLKERYDRED